MAESSISKRAVFIRGQQRKFILHAKNKLDLTWQEFSKLANTSVRNLTGWKNEKNSMSLDAVRIICKKTGEIIPSDIEIRDPYWYATKGAHKGGVAVYEKYGRVGGDSKLRKYKWRQWWESKGRYEKQKILEPLPFNKPRYSPKLAEFVGIVLGDGGMNKNQLKITLHCEDDLEYSAFVEGLLENLFNVKPKKYKKPNCKVFSIEISRVNLIKFCVDQLGLRLGNKVKNQVDIPLWVKKDRKYRIACLRGLVDTDGCVFIHRYKSRGIFYSYKKIDFTNRSKPLLQSVGDILGELGIGYRFSRDGYSIRIESKEGIDEYFSAIGSHNFKHLRKYRS